MMKNMKRWGLGLFLTLSIAAQAQITDSNTPLHLIPPDYPHAYGKATAESVKADLDKILSYLDKVTPTDVVDKTTGKKLDTKNPGTNAAFAKGDYRLFSYEWGVTYGGMLAMTQVSGDNRYKQYAQKRIELLASLAAYYKTKPEEAQHNSPVKSILHPHALDDAGALCVAMIKLQQEEKRNDLKPVIDHFTDFIMTKEYRLPDGTFARKRPLNNTVWLDDMFMSVPAIAYMGKLTGDSKYYDEATKQILLFSNKMFDHQKNIFIHGWLDESTVQPKYHWGRANGWAIMAITEVLNVLPDNHKDRKAILELYYKHVQGLAALQSGTGFWHQLLDKSDTYLETSATAIFTYSIVKGINNGWLDYEAFGPMALLAWEAVSTKIDAEGKVHGTCVGTGMGFDPAFYYYRPVNPYAAHSYGPMLLAGAEVMKLLKTRKYGINETAVQFLQK
jgi:unsaturated rhamnogalacturonyl hydrolase